MKFTHSDCNRSTRLKDRENELAKSWWFNAASLKGFFILENSRFQGSSSKVKTIIHVSSKFDLLPVFLKLKI